MADLDQFFPSAFELSVGKIRDLLADSVTTEDSNDLPLAGVCQASIPIPSALTFVEAAKHAHEGLSKTGAVLVREADAPHIPAGPTVIKTKSPQLAFASILAALYPTALGSARILDDDDHWLVRDDGAHVASTAVIEKNVRLSPGAVIGSRAQIGSDSVISACAFIASGCMIGRNCNIGPSANMQYAIIGDNVILHAGVCVGQDGFGYRPGPSGLHKVPQIGRVIIQNGVEIGSNTTVDRGAIGDTVIGENSKIDNLVQIGHNVVVGRNAIICAQAGLSGSCVVGDGAMLGGGAGIADHIHVGAGAQVAAAAGVMNDIPAGERWGGTPAQPLRAFFRELTALRSLVKNNKG